MSKQKAAPIKPDSIRSVFEANHIMSTFQMPLKRVTLRSDADHNIFRKNATDQQILFASIYQTMIHSATHHGDQIGDDVSLCYFHYSIQRLWTLLRG